MFVPGSTTNPPIVIPLSGATVFTVLNSSIPRPGILEYVPAVQSRQVIDELAATVVEYVPVTQFRQILEADIAEYVPCTQFRQILEADIAEYVPC